MSEILTGLCIKVADIGEKDKLITVITFEKGKVTIKAKSIRTAQSKMKLAAVPFAFGEYMIVEKNGFYTLTGFNQKEVFYDSWGDLNKSLASQVVLEVLDKVSFESADVVSELRAAITTLSYIDNAQAIPQIYVVWFLVQILCFMGQDFCDYEKIPTEVTKLIVAIGEMDIEHTESLDVSSSQLVQVLRYIQFILKEVENIQTRSIQQLIMSLYE